MVCLMREHVMTYRQTSYISSTFVGNDIVDHADVVDVIDHSDVVGAAPTTSSFLTEDLALMDWRKTTARRDDKYLSVGNGCVLH